MSGSSYGQRGHADGYSSNAREYLIVPYSSLLLATMVGGALLSLKVGVREFPRTDLRTPVQVPFEPDYHS